MARREYETFNGQLLLSDDDKEVTVDDCISAIGLGRAQVQLGILVGLAWVAEAMEVWVISLLGTYLRCEWNIQHWQMAVLTTTLFLGFGIGSVFVGRVADIMGRRNVIIFANAWCLFYSVLSAVSPWFSWLLVLRALVGMGLGSSGVLITYLAEYLPMKSRGKILLSIQVIWATGAMLEVALAYVMVEPVGWRWWMVASSIPIAIFLLFSRLLPQTPQFAIAQGNMEKARDILNEMARKNGVALPKGRLVHVEKEDKADWRVLFSPDLRLTSILVPILWLLFILNYYGLGLVSTVLLQWKGHSCNNNDLSFQPVDSSCSLECTTFTQLDYLFLFLVNSSDVPGTLIAMFTIDRFGRRRVMMFGFASSSVAIFCLIFCWSRLGMLIFMYIARLLISCSIAVSTVYTGEVFPTVVRAFGMGIAMASGRVGAIITPFIAQVLMTYHMTIGMLLYTACALLAAVIAYFLPIETCGRPLMAR